MLCLPIGVIRDLHLPGRQKIQLSIIFLTGGLYVDPPVQDSSKGARADWLSVLFAGITRMAVIYRAGSPTRMNLPLVSL